MIVYGNVGDGTTWGTVYRRPDEPAIERTGFFLTGNFHRSFLDHTQIAQA